ncbi:homoserine dehydrogenase [Proteiniborus ethanoligenes]|uniref:Homoserine dehydrogenase n=1 Tax=Proteiniborus ethanoligenes TaxID=415015 RepID=A0A1H3RDG5_9FIRM|nr:homoserine dehydrogenase [Proteiniborus ethanoligenes]SDZ23248.1 homoserine dehydrogenase [Proteiniborus ethanoligenes]
MIGIGLLGLGTVGAGVVEILNKRQEELKALTGKDIEIKKVLVKDINKKREIDLGENIITSDFEEIINHEDISIIVELTGDLEQSYRYIKRALNSGRDVVTANKAVVSKHFEELSSSAAEKNLGFLYEASVGGGIPILKPLQEALTLNNITVVQGILNGTCNYILTKMFYEGLDYGEVLKTAQELGYAEADPTADVEGYDTLRKLRILGTLALQGEIREEDILLEGISKITAFDIEQIKKMKSTVKLIGEAKELDEGFTAVVQPTIIKEDSYFANVNMAFNSVVFSGDNVGELKFYGSGAGKLPTANAVLSDVVDIIMGSYIKRNPLGERKLKNLNTRIKGEYYLRISSPIEEILKNIESISKELLSTNDNIALRTKEIEYIEIIKLLSSLGVHRDKYFLARILE